MRRINSASLIFITGVKMKNLLVIFFMLFCLIVSIPVFPQEVEKDTLTFIRNRSFDFYFVNGYAVGYKFNLDTRSSLKFILDFDGSYLNRISSYSDVRYELTEKRDNINLNLYAFYLYSLYKNNYADILLGIGPYYNVNYYSNKSVQTQNNISNSTYRIYYSSNYHALGGSIMFGIEGFITSHLSLIAEAHLTGSHRWEIQHGETTRNEQGIESDRYTSDGTSKSWFWEINFARLGIGIYF